MLKKKIDIVCFQNVFPEYMGGNNVANVIDFLTEKCYSVAQNENMFFYTLSTVTSCFGIKRMTDDMLRFTHIQLSIM